MAIFSPSDILKLLGQQQSIWSIKILNIEGNFDINLLYWDQYHVSSDQKESQSFNIVWILLQIIYWNINYKIIGMQNLWMMI